MSRLETIIAHGNRGRAKFGDNKIACKDGFTLSVIAGRGTYCIPRPGWPFGEPRVPNDYPGPYTAVEVGFPSERPEPWDEWVKYIDSPEDDPTGTVYGYVPVDMVRALIAAHGGEA